MNITLVIMDINPMQFWYYVYCSISWRSANYNNIVIPSTYLPWILYSIMLIKNRSYYVICK